MTKKTQIAVADKLDVQTNITESGCGVLSARLVYETPKLVHYGDVRDVTLGPTVGLGESGNELGRRNPP